MQENRKESLQNTLTNLLTFINFILTPKERIVFLELFQITLGKFFNDFEKNKSIEFFINPKISYFKKRHNISKDTVKRLNRKIRAHFSDYIQIERLTFSHSNLKGYDAQNRYHITDNLFYAFFLLKFNGFLKNKKTVHKSLMQITENKEFITTYEQWLTKKCARSKGKNAPAINYINKLITQIIEPSKVPAQRATKKYDDIIRLNERYKLKDYQIEKLMKKYSLDTINNAFFDAKWYESNGNIIHNPFHFISHCAFKENIWYLKSKGYYKHVA